MNNSSGCGATCLRASPLPLVRRFRKRKRYNPFLVFFFFIVNFFFLSQPKLRYNWSVNARCSGHADAGSLLGLPVIRENSYVWHRRHTYFKSGYTSSTLRFKQPLIMNKSVKSFWQWLLSIWRLFYDSNIGQLLLPTYVQMRSLFRQEEFEISRRLYGRISLLRTKLV